MESSQQRDCPNISVATLDEVAEFFAAPETTIKRWRMGRCPLPGRSGAWPLGEIARWRFSADRRADIPVDLRGRLQNAKTHLQTERRKLSSAQKSQTHVDRRATISGVRVYCNIVRQRLAVYAEELAPLLPQEERWKYIADIKRQMNLVCEEITDWAKDPDQE